MLPKLTYDLRFTSIPKQHRRSCFTSALKLVRESQQKTDAKDKKIVRSIDLVPPWDFVCGNCGVLGFV